jgi:hypothetical protein
MSDEATTVAGWKKAAVHNVLLPSGVRIDLKVVDLPALIEAGQIPQHLLEAALGVAGDPENQKPTKDLIVQEREFTDKLVSLSVVKPKVSEEDAAELPYEDKEMIVAIATRRRDLDAEGEHIAGLTASAKFRKFRELDNEYPALEGP